MKKIIRWQGLGVFCVSVVLIFIFAYLFADTVIESAIEQQGSRLVGARVDLGGADLSLFPAALELSDLQVANPDEPMRNIFEISTIKFSIDSGKLLLRKVIIDEMVMEGIRPDTPRKTSGAIEKRTKKRQESGIPAKESKSFTMPDLKAPDPKEILKKEKLETIGLAKDYQHKIKDDMEKWKLQLAELPNENSINQYVERLNKLKSSSGFAGILGGVSELGAIRDEIRNDLARLQNAQKDFSALSDSYHMGLKKIQKAPQNDINRLKEKYSLSAEGLANLSPILFGDKTANIVEQVLAWHGKARPLLERKKEKKGGGEIVKKERGPGVVVRFKEDEPLPDILIRTIRASFEVEAGSFGGKIMDVTPDQDIYGKPLSFSFAGESLKGINSIKINGVLDHINPARSIDNIVVEVNGFSIQGDNKSAREKQISISKGLLDLSGKAEFKEENISADILADLRSINLTSFAIKDGDAISGALNDTLSGVSELTAKITVAGTLEDYTINLNSNLDKILKKAVAKAIEGKASDFERELSDEVMKKVQGPISEAGGSFSDFGGISEELSSRLQQLGNLI